MNSFLKKIIALLSGVFLLSGFSQKVVAQCTPGFLGPENVGYILCSPTAQIDYINLFQVDASYNPILLPPNDTIKRAGQPDTIVTNQIKYMVIATLANGCKDTAIIRVPFNIDPYPDLGRDTIFTLCRGDKKDISHLYNPSPFKPIWSLPYPEMADTGHHTLRIETRDGCQDTANITISQFPYISLGNDTVLTRRPGELVNLFLQVDTANLALTWSTPTPAAAPIGFYWVIGLDSNGCRDTAIVEVCKRPDMGKDTTIKVCPGLTRNLNNVYTLTGLLPEFNTTTPSAVTSGIFRLIVTNYCGGKDTVNITVVNGTKPMAGIDLEQTICENETSNIAALYPITEYPTFWNLPDPEFAPEGTHRRIIRNADGCQDTSYVTVIALPRKPFYNDTTVYICGAQTKDLTQVFPFGEEAITEWVNIDDETNAATGVYTVSIEEDGCRYLLKVTVASEATRNAQIGVCTYTTLSGFSTNNFRSIIVDKQGVVWAGADGNGTTGGLYRYNRNADDCVLNNWSASLENVNSSYRDLHVSPIEGDNTLWCASNGHTAVQAIRGGVYKINSINDVKRFGSVLDGAGDGSLSSRFVNALAIAPNGKLYAAMGLSFNNNTQIYGKGDVNEYNIITNPDDFTKPAGIFQSSDYTAISTAGMRGNELWFAAVKSNEGNGTTVNPFIQRWNTITNSSAGTISQSNSPLPFDDRNDIVVRSIFTASSGRTFVGLSGGQGFAVAEAADPNQSPVWTLLTDQNSAFPKGAAVNFNAITEVNGEIWMGTTQGILVYDGVGPLTECSSYTLYNLSNGLPSNNITDIAYDVQRQEVWITSNAGVSRVVKSFVVSGIVKNVFVGAYPKGLNPKLNTRPLKNALVKLVKSDGTIADQITTSDDGIFNLKNSVAGQVYKVVVQYKTYQIEYGDVQANSFFENVLVPDSLILDLIALKDSIKQKEYQLKIPFEDRLSMVWDGKVPPVTVDGFEITDFEKSFEAFQGLVADRHLERIDNLANFYCTLATINDVGENALSLVDQGIELAQETIVGVTEFAGSLKDLKKFQRLWKDLAKSSENSPALVKAAIKEVNKMVDEGKKDLLGKLREQLADMLNESVKGSLDSNGQKVYDVVKIAVDKLLDKVIASESADDADDEDDNEDETEEEENETITKIKDEIKEVAIDGLKKLLSGLYYKYYTRIKHDLLIPKLAISTRDVLSHQRYNEVHGKIYDPMLLLGKEFPSLRKQASDMTENANEIITTEKGLAASASNWSDITKTASNLALASVAFAELAPILRAFSTGLQGLKLGLNGVALGTCILKGVQVGNISEKVVAQTGFPKVLRSFTLNTEACTPISLFTLEQAYKNYIQALNQYKIVISNPFDTVEYARRYREVKTSDAAFSEQLFNIQQSIWARHFNAQQLLPQYNSQIKELITSTFPLFKGQRIAFVMENIGYVFNPNKQFNASKILGLTDSIAGSAFVAYNALADIINGLNQSCVPAGAYLVQSGFADSTTQQPLSTGYFQYNFINFGSVALSQVQFKVVDVTPGYSLISSPGIQFNTIEPGQMVSVKYYYTHPSLDSAGSFDLNITSGNGSKKSLSGSLYTQLSALPNTYPISVKSGFWSDPTTWNTGQVPTAASAVTIRHTVTIDIDVACKTLKAESPAQVQVAAGKKLTVLE